MSLVAGLPLISLFEVTDQINEALPPSVSAFLECFSAFGLESRTAPGAIIHTGRLQALTAVLADGEPSFDLGFGELTVPGVTADLPFQLSIVRRLGNGNLEAAPEWWTLDLSLDDLKLELNKLEAARLIETAGTFPRHLVRLPGHKPVAITGRATLRLEKPGSGQNVVARFIDRSDPFDPRQRSGVVAGLSVTPPHFFIGRSEFGMTITELLFDFSDTYTPPQIMERGHSADWVGLAIGEATFYCPQNATGGGFSAGISNVLIGDPFGLQGELELQWGRTTLDAAAFVFIQSRPDDPSAEVGVGADFSDTFGVVQITAAHDEPVDMRVSLQATEPPEGGSRLEDWKAHFVWPDDRESEGDLACGSVRHGQTLMITPIEKVSGQPEIRHPAFSIRFVSAGTGPRIDATVNDHTFKNVTHLSAPGDRLAEVELKANSSAPERERAESRFIWLEGVEGIELTGATINPPLAGALGNNNLSITEIDAHGQKRNSFVELAAIDHTTLQIGCEAGVFRVDDSGAKTGPITPARVKNTFDRVPWHVDGQRKQIVASARVDASSTTRLFIPAGALALVETEEGGSAAVNAYDRHVQILMPFDDNTPLNWGPAAPARNASTSPESLPSELLTWASHYPGATFLVIGRCDDLGTDDYNVKLAQRRVQSALNMLTTGQPEVAAIDASRILSRGEQGTPVSLGAEQAATDPRSTDQKKALRLIEHDPRYDDAAWPDELDTAHACEDIRKIYRRVDIYALAGSPTDEAVTGTIRSGDEPYRRESLVPAPGREPVPAPEPTPRPDYRFLLRLGWDKPHASGWGDLVPSLAEFEYAWTPSDMAASALDLEGRKVALKGGRQEDGRQVLTVYGKWIHDDLTDFTKVMLGLKSEGDSEGLVQSETKELVAACALGPMLLSGVDTDNDVVGSAARIAALAGVAAFARTPIAANSKPLIGDGSKATLIAVEAEAETRSLAGPGESYTIRLTSEYTATVHINAGKLGLRTKPECPARIRYKNVGVSFASDGATFWDKLGLEYKSNSTSIEDPGQWQISGDLGDLLRVTEIAMGVGSYWIEARLALALDLGVVEITEAVMRVTFPASDQPPAFSLRGLAASIDIPAAVKGEGRLRIENDGAVKAGIDVNIVPLKLSASAALALSSEPGPPPFTFMNLFIKVQFPTGIPLGPSGAALHGVLGQVVVNGRRDVPATADVVARELGWWNMPPEDKYRAEGGQHVLGVGVVVGTLPDASFAFSATGMLVVAFRDPEVILGVEVEILKIPVRAPAARGGSADAAITGLIVIDDKAVTVAVSASYEIPKLVEITLPFGAYFPYDKVGTYVRIGSDGQEGRSGEPVTVTLLPGTLDLKAWSYLMIEQDGLPRLGGKPEFSFDGFSIGFGAGVELRWSAGPIKLEASAYTLVGFGTDPLFIKGGLFVSGELDLVVVSISAHGEIILTYADDDVFLDGRFCGEVDCFFFSLKGCVTFEIGNRATETIAEPDPPVATIALTDRKGRVMGGARAQNTGTLQGKPIFLPSGGGPDATNDGVDPLDNNTVWPDTAPILNFRHFIADAIPDGSTIDPGPQESGSAWFGSNRLKYAYQLRAVRLIRERDEVEIGGNGDVQSVWMTRADRQADSAADTDGPLPSEAETWQLKLLHWDPYGWAEPLDDGGASAGGDPGESVARLCEPMPQPRAACLFGRDARRIAPHRVRLVQTSPAPGPYPSRFSLSGQPGVISDAPGSEGPGFVSRLIAAGATFEPGHDSSLPAPVAIAGENLTRGYRLPRMRQVSDAGLSEQISPWVGRTDRLITDAYLTLLICDGPEIARQPRKTCFDFTTLQIGSQHNQLVTDMFTVRANEPRDPVFVSDRFDAGRFAPGQDRVPELTIGYHGAEFFFRRPCAEIEISFMRAAEGPTEFIGIDTAGNSHPVTVDQPQARPGIARIRSNAAGLVRLKVRPSTKSINIWRLCCLAEIEDTPGCVDLSGLAINREPRPRIRHDGHVFHSLDSGRGLSTADVVKADAQPPQRGHDGVAEIGFPAAGMRIDLPTPARQIDVSLMLFSGPVTVEAFDAAGKAVGKNESPRGASGAVTLRLRLDDQAVALRLFGGSNEAFLFGLCAMPAPRRHERCVDFDGSERNRKQAHFAHAGMEFEDLAGQDALVVTDHIDATGYTPPRGGQQALAFADHGLEIRFNEPAEMVTLKLINPGRSELHIEALDGFGRRVARHKLAGDRKTSEKITLQGKELQRVIIAGGSGSARLARVCIRKPATTNALPERGTAELPAVFSHTRNADGARPVALAWDIVSTRPLADKSTCRVVTYAAPTALTAVDAFMILGRNASEVTLLSLCGIDQSARRRRDADASTRDARRRRIGDPESTTNDVLLDPDESYRIEIDWSWTHWSKEQGQESPPDPSDWVAAADSQVFRFRTAAETQAHGTSQDGLNEYVFDPRDIARYLNRMEPGDGRDVVFTADPIWAHFSTRHLPALLARYDRKLGLRVKRTDPPPQPGGHPIGAERPALDGILEWLAGPTALDSPRARRLDDAVAAAPCLPDTAPFGGGSLAGRFPLDPLAMYDLELVAARTDGSDGRVVAATRFRTSRYAAPEDLLHGFDVSLTDVSPFPPDEFIIRSGNLPSGALDVSDAKLGTALAAVEADLLPLPTEAPQIRLFWQLDGAVWRVAGVLLDSPEPLRREHAVQRGQTSEITTRVAPDSVRIDGGHIFQPVRATLNWTRVLFVPETPVQPGADPTLELRFSTSDGTISGRRVLTRKPRTVIAEGF